MKDYIKSLLPRLRLLSKKLDDEANFVDIPWTFRDDDGNLITHLFRRNSQLLVSINGDVIIGHWEYIPSMNSLLIDYQNKKQLFNHGYLDPDKGVLLLLKDGTDDIHILANRNQIPDLNVIGYIESLISKGRDQEHPYLEPDTETNNITLVPFDTDKGVIEVEQKDSFSNPSPGKKAYLNNLPAPSGKYRFGFMWYVHIQDGIVKQVTMT
jgi:hypothetical protein